MKKFRRINLYGGPNAGKSTATAGTFYLLRSHDVKIEHVQEYVKSWAYQKKIPQKWDQLYFLSKQIQKETIPLNNGCDFVITDSPILLSYVYAIQNDLPYKEEILSICKQFEEEYPSINVYLSREKEEYNPLGRFHDMKQAVDVDILIQKILLNLEVDYVSYGKKNVNVITDYILQEIEKGNN